MKKGLAMAFLLVVPLSLVACQSDKPKEQVVEGQVVEQQPSQNTTGESITSSFTNADGQKQELNFSAGAGKQEQSQPVVIGQDEPMNDQANQLQEGLQQQQGVTEGIEQVPTNESQMDLSKLPTDAQSTLKDQFGMEMQQELPDLNPNSGVEQPQKPKVEGKEVQFSEVNVKTASQEIQAWVEQKKKLIGVSSKSDANLTYLLVSAGEKPNSGTQVVVDGVYQTSDRIKIPFTIKEPDSGTMTLQVISYPYKLIVIPKTDLPINFERY